MVHFVKRLGKVKVNYIVVIANQNTLDDVVNVLEEMSEAAATFTKPVLLVAQYAVRLKVANKFLSDYSLEDLYEVGSERYSKSIDFYSKSIDFSSKYIDFKVNL